jgi:hypothetical protein
MRLNKNVFVKQHSSTILSKAMVAASMGLMACTNCATLETGFLQLIGSISYGLIGIIAPAVALIAGTSHIYLQPHNMFRRKLTQISVSYLGGWL